MCRKEPPARVGKPQILLGCKGRCRDVAVMDRQVLTLTPNPTAGHGFFALSTTLPKRASSSRR